jgi:VanZ family protein
VLKRKALRILLASAALSILILSLIPIPADILGEWNFSDKLLHFAAYLVLSFLAFFSFEHRSRLKIFLLALLASFSFGGLIELLQFLTQRQPELMDLAVNFAGSLSGAAAGAVISRLSFFKIQ